MTPAIIASLKSFDWQKIIDYGNSLADLNDAQLRFIKGLAVEQAVEAFGDGDLESYGLVVRNQKFVFDLGKVEDVSDGVRMVVYTPKIKGEFVPNLL